MEIKFISIHHLFQHIKKNKPIKGGTESDDEAQNVAGTEDVTDG